MPVFYEISPFFTIFPPQIRTYETSMDIYYNAGIDKFVHAISTNQLAHQ
ncbi:MAG TPA: hypothetical protein VEP89_00825 [Draconibacterium sp.]|nr:hypothetical protein [Draconibacterium sp.]